MDFYYDPENATMLTEWILYMSPVPETQSLIQEDADKPKGGTRGTRVSSRRRPRVVFLYPDEELLSPTTVRLRRGTDETAEEWDSIFLPISQS